MTALRVEHLDAALGIQTEVPRLSWQLPAGAVEQQAYRVTTDNGWDTGLHRGEWLEPGVGPGPMDAFVAADKGDVATAFPAHSAGLAARIAGVVGEDPTRWSALADGVRDAWQREHVRDGRLTVDTQAGGHLATGWLAMVDVGSTTVWERWDGVRPDGTPHESLNHCSEGAVVSFLRRYTAGISLVEPGYRRFRVAARPGGRIDSTWSLTDGRFELRVVVPAGTSAEVVLPDGTAATAGPGTHSCTCGETP